MIRTSKGSAKVMLASCLSCLMNSGDEQERKSAFRGQRREVTQQGGFVLWDRSLRKELKHWPSHVAVVTHVGQAQRSTSQIPSY